MILQRLVEYYDRLRTNSADTIPAFGFSRERVGFELVIAEDGTAELQDLRSATTRIGPKKAMNFDARWMVVPYRGDRSSNVKSNFLWDNTGYVFGRTDKPGFEQKKQQDFLNLHRLLLNEVSDIGLAALVKFLSTWYPQQYDRFRLAADATGENIVFRLRGERRYIHDSPAIQSAWARFFRLDINQRPGCSLIDGVATTIAETHFLVGGVSGAQVTGASLSSFNASAYTSYGLESSFNSPVSIDDVFKYTTVLKEKLVYERRKIALGDATVTFWAEQADRHGAKLAEDAAAMVWGDQSFTYDDTAAPAEHKARVDQVDRFLKQLKTGHATSEAIDAADSTGFYVLGLSPNASRISVRFWYDGTVGDFKERLAKHLRDTDLIGARDDDRPLNIKRIVEVCGRYDEKKQRYDADAVPPTLTGAVARAVLLGTPYPRLLLNVLLNRIRADGDVRHDRVAAIKACLIRTIRDDLKEVPVALDTNRTEAAYVTGRLFAVLERIQTDALGKEINSTIKDRYFGAASATPGMIFPRLIRLGQHHLSNIGKEKPGLKVNHDRLLGEVIGKLNGFPSHLHLEDQGLFAVGYYHQRQDFYTSKNPQDEGATE